MIRLPQEASVMSGHPNHKVIPGLQKAITLNRLLKLDGGNGNVRAVVDDTDETIIPFTIPTLVYDVRNNPVMCVDLRKTRREYDVTATGTFIPKPYTETKFLVDFASSILAWSTNANSFSNIYFDTCRIYAMLMSGKLGKQLVLQPQQMNELTIYFAYYFATRYMVETEVRESDYQLLVMTRLARILPFSPDEIMSVLSIFNRKVVDNLDELCAIIKQNNDNPKIQKLNGLFVTTVVMNSWAFSGNARELMAIAVEYPPCFISLVNRALGERSFKDTGIAQIALRILNTQAQKNYILQYSNIVYNSQIHHQ